MRKFVLAVVVLAVLVAAYWGWALAGAAALASAASRGDAEAVMRRVDLMRVTRSLSEQVAHAFLDQNPQFRKLLSIEQGFVGSAGAGAFNALIREMLTEENITALLNAGQVGAQNSGLSMGRMPPLAEAFRAGPWRALALTRFDGPLSFVVDLPGAEGRYAVHLHLDGTTWRLSGIEVPGAVSARLAREVAAKIAASADRGR